MLQPPTLAQQRGLAYAPIPFAVTSFLSSSYVVCHLLFRERRLLRRLYHRLVLAMNVAQLPLSFTYAWSTAAIPEGTPNFVGTRGTVASCTAAGVLCCVFILAVATYYVSLVLQAFLGVRNNFNEEKYRWLEIAIHLVAYVVPCIWAAMTAAAENFNPSGTTCYFAKAPLGCDDDPGVECERGTDTPLVVFIVNASQVCLYFVYPPIIVLAMHLWMKRASKKALRRCSGSRMSIIRETARKEMMKSVHRQISVYLLSFWCTWVLSVARPVVQQLTGKIPYDLQIAANCAFALQGFVFMVVYFTLQKMGRGRRADFLPTESSSSERLERPLSRELTVSEIRSNVHRKSIRGIGAEESADGNAETGRFDFNIFDGEPDPDSPWAVFFDQGDCSDEEEGATDEELPNHETELANERNGSKSAQGDCSEEEGGAPDEEGRALSNRETELANEQNGSKNAPG